MDHQESTLMLDRIAKALLEAGYDPSEQLTGYLQHGDLRYITRRHGARDQIALLDKAQIRTYLDQLDTKH